MRFIGLLLVFAFGGAQAATVTLVAGTNQVDRTVLLSGSQNLNFGNDLVDIIVPEGLSITSIDESCTKQAVKNPKINDLENGIQYYSALNCESNYIITDDVNGFYYSEIKVMEPSDFLRQPSYFFPREPAEWPAGYR